MAKKVQLALIPEHAQRLSGSQKAKQNKDVWGPVFAFGETGMTTNGGGF